MGQSRRLIEDEVERLKSGYEITIEDEPEEYP
jgi:hypothetical protein